MRTIQTKVYSFSELSEDAKETAINEFRSKGIETGFIYDDAYQSVKKFHTIFGTKEGHRSWLYVQTSHIDDCILELTGLRLQKYIWNNYKQDLFKGKYYSLWSKKDISYKYHKEGYPVLKARYSKIILENSCVMTGVCYDHDLLQPFYDYLNKKDFSNDNTTLYDLFQDAFSSLEESIEREVEFRNSDESIIEYIESNSYEFTKEGIQF